MLIINKIRKLTKFIPIISDPHIDTYMVYPSASCYCYSIDIRFLFYGRIEKKAPEEMLYSFRGLVVVVYGILSS